MRDELGDPFLPGVIPTDPLPCSPENFTQSFATLLGSIVGWSLRIFRLALGRLQEARRKLLSETLLRGFAGDLFEINEDADQRGLLLRHKDAGDGLPALEIVECRTFA